MSQQPFSSDGGFVTAGNITVSESASPAPSINGFFSVNSNNISLGSGRINGGDATVVTDGINSIAQAPGATMDVFGFPFADGPARGQLTITDVTTPSEANGTWYYQSFNNSYTYQIYTDSTYSTLVDASGWSAYTGGGSVAITLQSPPANIVINSNGYFSKFDNTGNLTISGDLLIPNNSSITTTNATGNVVGKSINIRAGSADLGDYYTTAGGNLNLVGGVGATNDGGGGGPGGAVNITAGTSADPAGHAGNVTINAGSNTWTFDYNGVATLPGEGILRSIDDTVTLTSLNTSTGNANSVYLGTSGGLGFNDGEIGGNWLEIFRTGAEPEIRVPVGRGNLNLQTAQGNTAYNWVLDNTGNLSAPGNISTTGNVFAGTLSLSGNIAGNISFTGTDITINNSPGGQEGGELKWALPAPGNTVLSTGLTQDVFQNGMRFFESGGNTRGLYMDLGNAPNGTSTAVGYRDIPQVSFTGNTTISVTDAGRHYYSILSTGNVLTIANNASQGFQVGAAITIVNQGTGNITVAQGSGVTLYLAGNATSGNRTVTTFGMATLIKVATNTWFINGTGVS